MRFRPLLLAGLTLLLCAPAASARTLKIATIAPAGSSWLVEMKKTGVSLWAVTWRQPVVFNPEPNADPLPIELYVNGEEL